MYKKIFLILFVINCDVISAASVADSWILFAKALKDSWSHCPIENGLFQCLKHSSLEVFDKMIKSDVIPLTENVRLERFNHLRKISFDSDASIHNTVWNVSSLSTETWSKHILKKMFYLFKTHRPSITPITARRRHRNDMLPMAVLGVTAFGVFTVPMGFQFLLILCGKAVLISKMALLLASINGSRRVEHSGAHHGLHHPGMHNHGYHYWDRGEINQRRFSV